MKALEVKNDELSKDNKILSKYIRKIRTDYKENIIKKNSIIEDLTKELESKKEVIEKIGKKNEVLLMEKDLEISQLKNKIKLNIKIKEDCEQYNNLYEDEKNRSENLLNIIDELKNENENYVKENENNRTEIFNKNKKIQNLKNKISMYQNREKSLIKVIKEKIDDKEQINSILKEINNKKHRRKKRKKKKNKENNNSFHNTSNEEEFNYNEVV